MPADDALPQLLHEITVTQGVALTPDAADACRDIFERTVGSFAREAAAKGATMHPWEHDGFRAFIVGQAARIANRAKAQAGSAPVSADVLRRAAVEEMHRTHQVCRIAAERGQLKFSLAETSPNHEGQMCAGFLSEEGQSSQWTY